jgi:hypothetical protein
LTTPRSAAPYLYFYRRGRAPEQAIVVDPELSLFLETNCVSGNGFNELNTACDAKVVGDYTGLTAL